MQPSPDLPADGGRRPGRPKLTLRKRLTFMSIAIVLGFVVAFAAGEVLVRVFGWPNPGLDTKGADKAWPIKRTGKDGGMFPPGVWRLKHYDYDTEWAVNKDGFRERERVVKKPGRYRVLVLGDSFAAGHGVELDKRFTDVWSREIQKAHPNVEVWNLATGMSGTGNMSDVLAGIGKKYEYDEVALGFFSGNDLDDNRDFLRSQADPNFVPSAARDAGLAAKLRYSRLATFVYQNFVRGMRKYPAWGVYNEAQFTEIWPATEQLLDQLKANTQGKPLTIWYIPTKWEWSDELWRQAKEQFHYSDADRLRTKTAVRDWAKRNDVPFLDCAEYLKDADPEKIHFKIDGHWNDIGHELVAKGLAHDRQSAAFLRDPKLLGDGG